MPSLFLRETISSYWSPFKMQKESLPGRGKRTQTRHGLDTKRRSNAASQEGSGFRVLQMEEIECCFPGRFRFQSPSDGRDRMLLPRKVQVSESFRWKRSNAASQEGSGFRVLQTEEIECCFPGRFRFQSPSDGRDRMLLPRKVQVSESFRRKRSNAASQEGSGFRVLQTEEIECCFPGRFRFQSPSDGRDRMLLPRKVQVSESFRWKRSNAASQEGSGFRVSDGRDPGSGRPESLVEEMNATWTVEHR